MRPSKRSLVVDRGYRRTGECSPKACVKLVELQNLGKADEARALQGTVARGDFGINAAGIVGTKTALRTFYGMAVLRAGRFHSRVTWRLWVMWRSLEMLLSWRSHYRATRPPNYLTYGLNKCMLWLIEL